MASTESEALWLARVTLADPYPADVFSELSDDEMKVIQEWLQKCPVRHASDRLHASWARHLYTVAKHTEAQQ